MLGGEELKNYCKGLESTEQQCLNCPFEMCRYDSAEVSKLTRKPPVRRSSAERPWIIRKESHFRKGGFRVSYITSFRGSKGTNSRAERAMRFTRDEARNALRMLANTFPDTSKLIIVKRDEEIEKNKKASGVLVDGVGGNDVAQS